MPLGINMKLSHGTLKISTEASYERSSETDNKHLPRKPIDLIENLFDNLVKLKGKLYSEALL